METEKKDIQMKMPCKNCGAELRFKPGTTSVGCDYCGHVEEVVVDENGFVELELMPYLKKMGALSHSEKISILDCGHCGASQHFEDYHKSLHCVYCGTPLVTEAEKQEDWILPGAVLPFQLEQSKAHKIFKKWVDSLWFAPNNLKKASLQPHFTQGLYLPYWTFDAHLEASYAGQRGDYYYETKRVRGQNGKMVNQRVRKTRWRPASGRVTGFVDDTLVRASHQRKGRIPNKIARWDLDLLKPFDASFLKGFVTEKYTIPLKEGHLGAKKEAENIAANWCRRDIGGDTQRITHLDMQLYQETFKHVLLPVYISTYRYNGQEYAFYVNGENGTISGKRPYSTWKIVLAILFGLLLLLLFAYFA